MNIDYIHSALDLVRRVSLPKKEDVMLKYLLNLSTLKSENDGTAYK